jgi:CDP-diacylglycerol--glycerol-3-phosphate 3-phosphatidyltransferase
MYKTGFYIVNAITLYRLTASFFLLFLVLHEKQETFKWMLTISFLTDAIDGFLARRWRVVTEIGSRLDSTADDLTVLMAIIGMCSFKTPFVLDHLPLILFLTGIYLAQLALAFYRYHKPTSYHTYLAKAAAFMQGAFFVLLFFLPQPVDLLFYLAAGITLLDLAEEIILVLLLPRWQADVKGLFWLKQQKAKI